MPSENNDANNKVIGKKPSNLHGKKKLTWILSVAFLALVVIVFVFSPMIGAFAPRRDSVVFGSYDGTPIEYAYGNYFYQQQQNIAANWDQETTDANYQWQIYQIWKQAFDNTVIHTAVMQQAAKSSMIVTEEAVDTYLLKNGPYIGDNGEFSSELYNQTSASRRNEIRESTRDSMLFTKAIDDMFTTMPSRKEVEFISSMAQEARAFNYVTFPLSLYPRERVLSFAQANAILFTEANLSLITLPDESQESQEVLQQIRDGQITFEDAAREYSIDQNAQTGGRLGEIPFFEISSLLGNEDDAHAVFSLAPGETSDIFSVEYGTIIFKLNEQPALPDYESDELVRTARSYIEEQERDLVINYVSARAEDFTAAARASGFPQAAEQMELEMVTTRPTPLNYGNSAFMNSFSYTDPERGLAALSTDEEALGLLYSLEEQEISEPITADETILVASVDSIEETEVDNRTVEMLFPYYTQQIKQEELTEIILNSDKLENNFMRVFLNQILQNG